MIQLQQILVRVCTALVLTLAALPLVSHGAPLDPAAAKGKKLLYVYNQTKLEKARAMAPPPDDPKRIPSLESWRSNDQQALAMLKTMGFSVSETDEFSSLDAVKGQDFIVVSESVDALEIGTKYRNVTIPLLTFENDLLGELGMVGWKNGRDTGTEDNQRFLWLVNAPHPLSAGLAPGIQNVLMDENLKMSWGKPGLGAIIIATLRGEPDKAAIFAYEKGATMYGDFLAPARRVSFFLWQNNFEQMRPEGVALFKAAVLWAVTRPD